MERTESPVLDLLVAGGGPGGTATAFRARELGLSTLVVDYDDLMKRIRDYSKDKLILPSFGGGDRMAFPKAGECVSCLEFDPIDKDEMCERWKGLYRQFEVPARIGLELTGIERRADGPWEVATWDHGHQREEVFAARHVVIAIGRGVPRRFDIPGNTDGIAFRLTDPQRYVGRPACVIGGGTSAAEAVLAISNAKAAAGDPTEVFWSYRGDKLPRVSKALAEVFFAAYIGNGNIRYFRRSEPVAIVTGDDHEEYVAVRIDRRRLEGRPTETSHLEFPKSSCLACIGEDVPTTLFETLGLPMVAGGPKNRRRMMVNRFLESCQPNVYLVGDILSQAYFETDDFEADPSTFREIKHRGNIKTALRDGVLVADVIKQRLEGKTEIEVTVEDAEPRRDQRSVVMAALTGSFTLDEIAAAAEDGEADEAGSGPVLIQVLRGGVQGEEVTVKAGGTTTIGRHDCDLTFPEDTLLASHHASIVADNGDYLIRDVAAGTGVFLQVPSSRKLEVATGSLLCVGRQFLVLDRSSSGPALVQYDERGAEVGRHSLRSGTMVIGRDAPDVVLDADDLSLSRRHLAVALDDRDRVLVKDLKSVNGTYLQVRGETALEHGARFRVGQQIFAFSLAGEAVLDTDQGPPSTSLPSVSAAPTTPSSSAAAAGPPTGPSVTFAGRGVTLPAAGRTVCEVAEEHGVKINAECHSGICGSDPVRIVAGREHIDGGPSPGECETLEDICDLDPGECRLACMMRVKGPVEVEIVED